MKFTIVCLFAIIVAINAGPTQITDNNVGDIITVGVNANLDIDNKIDATLVNVLVEILNRQLLRVNPSGIRGNSEPSISPELIQNVVQMLSNPDGGN